MTPLDQPNPLPAPRAKRMAAFSVHLLTAAGVGIALLSMLEAVREHWAAMFGWLGLALVIDGIDGPLARRFDVQRLQPDWDGDVLDLVVDFVTYVFVPAYAITASGLLMPIAAPILGVGIVISSALYFADRKMKTADNHFRGFPALWNAAAFYLFLLHPPPIAASIGIAALIVLTFVPFNVLHPVRVARFRKFNLILIAIWAVLAIYVIMRHFEVPAPVTVTLCAIAIYIGTADAAIRLIRRVRPQ
ncbi:CDP-alcohol phosphatidyltransferase family protein [Rhodopseudomonas palustris]|uniref:phosphatidylcholine synthase n=1 Tax=Rhodopseudomonas palustris TaxID=1076 RepID=UPI002ACEB35C|nr:CDP-alcohol phosphatidyltransferase family protein [Rhodopseudomonas palustris]WQH00738.1 CDP-alcohol phosphatidyltransferase family protein [Rhodopseudomonas palustris]